MCKQWFLGSLNEEVHKGCVHFSYVLSESDCAQRRATSEEFIVLLMDEPPGIEYYIQDGSGSEVDLIMLRRQSSFDVLRRASRGRKHQ